MRRRNVKSLLLATALLVLFTETVFGWPWNTDMYWQQSIKPQTAPPVAPVDETMALGQEPPMTREDAKTLVNPTPPTPESIERGKKLFDTFCFPCHGKSGHGDGPVGKKFVTPADLHLPMYKAMTDGYIYGTIRMGAINMPPQGAAIYPAERWDIVNYVRSLQKQ